MSQRDCTCRCCERNRGRWQRVFETHAAQLQAAESRAQAAEGRLAQHQPAIEAANAILEAARPLVLNLERMRDAAIDTARATQPEGESHE